MRCAVSNCKNTNNRSKKHRYFQFPKCAEICEKWIEFCRRTDAINSKTACICNEHFVPEDFERNMQYEMGFGSKNPTKLRPGAIPTVDSSYTVLCSKTFLEENARKKIVNALLEESVASTEQFFAADAHSIDNMVALETQVEQLERENCILKEGEKKYAAEINKLKDSLRKAEFERDNMKRKLKCISSEGQVTTIPSRRPKANNT